MLFFSNADDVQVYHSTRKRSTRSLAIFDNLVAVDVQVYRSTSKWSIRTWAPGGRREESVRKRDLLPGQNQGGLRILFFFLCIFHNEFIISDQAGPKDCLTHFLFPEFLIIFCLY